MYNQQQSPENTKIKVTYKYPINYTTPPPPPASLQIPKQQWHTNTRTNNHLLIHFSRTQKKKTLWKEKSPTIIKVPTRKTVLRNKRYGHRTCSKRRMDKKFHSQQKKGVRLIRREALNYTALGLPGAESLGLD